MIFKKLFRKENHVRDIILQSIFYAAILIALLYLYHYKHFGETAFIYNEF
ncbi:MAG: teichoic acid D-Ala incorporation-associated protein DltX [Clostridiales Family XIII bacterium]|nr:teichoic acid D-Ala incorporation-associated protein DltX [Clostridiales Family XIII bacterium]